MLQRKRNLDSKIPEIRKTLEMVQFLQSQANEGDDSKEVETLYELNDTLYATAKIKPTGTVCLWLGVCSLGAVIRGRSPCCVCSRVYIKTCALIVVVFVQW
jgi:hypothetical protein